MASLTASTAVAVRPDAGLRRWRNALFVVFGVSGLLLSSWAARVPSVRSTLGLSTDTLGLILLAVSIGAIVGLTIAPQIQLRIGTRRGVLLMIVIAAVGLAAVAVGAGLLVSLPVVVAGLAVLGFGNGVLDVMMNVSAASCEKRIGRTILPLMHACFSLGTVVGAGLGAAAAALDVSVLWHFVAMAVVCVVTGIVVTRFIPRTDAIAHDDAHLAPTTHRTLARTVRDQLAVWADWRLILIGVVMLGMAFAEGTANDWMALGAVEGHGLDDAGGALVLDVFVAAMTVGRITGGPLVDRIGRVGAIRITAALGVIGVLLFITTMQPWAYITGAVLWGLGASLGFPLGMSAAADDEHDAGARVSAVAMIGYVAFLGGPPLMGFLGQAVGVLDAFFVVLVLLAAAFFCAPALRHRPRTASRAPRPGAVPGEMP